MPVCLYSGSLGLVRKSGVGEAIFHQREMLHRIGIETTDRLSQPAEAVHFNTVFPDSFFASFRARLQKKKIVYYGHSTQEDFRNSFKGSNALAPLFKLWIKLCYSRGDIILTPTEYSKKLLEGYGLKRPIYSISNGIDTDFFAPSPERRAAFREKYELKPEEKAVISVGHFIERKGICEFVQLAREMPELRFFWFGFTSLSIVPKAIGDAIAAAPENLKFPGYVNREELRDAYCGCDAFVFMSKEETEGIVVLEAMACGIATLVRNIPVYEGWLEDGVNVYKAASDDEFRQKAQGILNGSLPSLTAAGLQVAKDRNLTAMGEKLLAIYRREGILKFD